MPSPIRVVDGGKSATFDGFVLEVFGVNGSTDSKHLAANTIDQVGVAAAGEDWMFLVKSRKGGFGIAISLEKKPEWEQLAQAVTEAISQRR